jgi:hypothetical protein
MFLAQNISTTFILSINLAAALATFVYICRIIIVSVSDRYADSWGSCVSDSIDRSALHRYVGDLKRSLDNQRVKRRRVHFGCKQVVELCRELITSLTIKRHWQAQA